MKIIGHRGARGLAPENTLAGFKKALEHHVDEIECDVRVTKDRIPILIHDPFLTDEADNRLKIADHTLAKLREHKADLVTMEAAIRLVDRRVPIILEVKPDQPIAPIKTVLNEFLQAGWQVSDFRLASFSYKTLRQLHAAFPEITKIVNDSWSGSRATWRARRLGTKRLCLNKTWLWPYFNRAMRRRGYEVYAYTVNETRWRLFMPGLYGVVTDYPDVFEKK
jgi:glycerophosphoryl diester phosphodiesterase